MTRPITERTFTLFSLDVSFQVYYSRKTSDRKAENSKYLPVNCARDSTYSSVTAGERARARISNALVQSGDE